MGVFIMAFLTTTKTLSSARQNIYEKEDMIGVKKEYRFSIFFISITDFRQKDILNICFQKTIVMPKIV
jgi:hypothetical protein